MSLNDFSDFTENRIVWAKDNGMLVLFKDFLINILIFYSPITLSFASLIFCVLLFLLSGTKQTLLSILIVGFFSNRKEFRVSKIKAIGYVLALLMILIIAQLVRSVVINVDVLQIIYAVAVPFDGYDNAVQIYDSFSRTLSSHELNFFPLDFQYALESVGNYIPRIVWADKPEILGYWRIQEDYLPLLFSSTSGMSVSMSYPIDLLLSFGLILGIFVIFVFGLFVALVDHPINYSSFQFFLLAVFALNFSRNGFNAVIPVILQLFAYFLFAIFFSNTFKQKTSRDRLTDIGSVNPSTLGDRV